MGASLSNLTESNGSANGRGRGLGDIPESCVACVFLYLTPPEICNLARLNRAFRGAASSDSVWESKLPHNYQDLLDLMPPERYLNLSKKDIFALLSRPVPFDDGNKEVWLDRVTGSVCMSISAKGMAITGIDDRRYWNWVSTEESGLDSKPSESDATRTIFQLMLIDELYKKLLAMLFTFCDDKIFNLALWFQEDGVMGDWKYWDALECLWYKMSLFCCLMGHRLFVAKRDSSLPWGSFGNLRKQKDNLLVAFLEGDFKLGSTITANQSLSGDQIIVFNGGIFKLGFYNPGNSSNYYICMWILAKTLAPYHIKRWQLDDAELKCDWGVQKVCPELSSFGKWGNGEVLGIYTVSFRIHLGRFSKRLGRRVCNFEHTHGWSVKPVRFEFSTSDGQQASIECCLDDNEPDDINGNHKRGCWIQYKVGEFIVTESDPATEVRFSMKQIDCTHSKGGLCVDSVSIIPSDLKEQRRRGVLK
ncbi:hypothetical protein TEA_025203 [Camellia sinensis var. sinensis]|uniref:F-box domain-containing protein n=1 Tax=Camellia sinensis var. sinensis TaxID=542762 RepID=A0A4S4D7D7_CAMSN|nr:hypothetical protein TEA_025203 [Camellia sinensis var. sinensis]